MRTPTRPGGTDVPTGAVPVALYSVRVDIKVDTRGREAGPPGYFDDADGFLMPLAPNTRSRRIPLGDFPTGPEVGTRLPEVVAIDQYGRSVDLHADRRGQPAVLVFSRSAVW